MFATSLALMGLSWNGSGLRRLPAQQHIDGLHAHHNIMFLIYDFDK